MVLTGRPERLKVMATRRGVLLVAGHGPIEADTGPGEGGSSHCSDAFAREVDDTGRVKGDTKGNATSNAKGAPTVRGGRPLTEPGWIRRGQT
ncbi:hypothetical protein GCM10010344_14910 [Streptomyces bluensis]|nr:hypothetical protein GCM10010344_14910 [Streptomyces bluensis]